MISSLQKARSTYKPPLPMVFKKLGASVQTRAQKDLDASSFDPEIKDYFPNLFGSPLLTFVDDQALQTTPIKVGVIFSGGQAPGGHNVIGGLFDGLKSIHPENKLIGFQGGPSGLIENNFFELTKECISQFRNSGGFDLIGSGRTKLENQEQFTIVQKNCEKLGISALIIIGGDDSNTNACLLAEYFLSQKANINVIGCPKTIDGDLKNDWIETSFGFDTASKVYSELIGNICRDSLSAKKYWHFIKLMGRSASHIAVECALQTQPNLVLVSEEIADKKSTLSQITENLSSIVLQRSQKGLNFGVVLIPEGLIEFIPEMNKLIQELNDLLAKKPSLPSDLASAQSVSVLNGLGLSENSSCAYLSLPARIREQLVLDRDPHGNVQVSKIQTEELLITKVSEKLLQLKQSGEFLGDFSAQPHFFGYEGRCALPSNFDANYCYGLGYTASALIGAGKTGYIASIRNSHKSVSEWEPLGVPITVMMNVERRHGKDKPVIKKALVNLKGTPFNTIAKERETWALENHYLFPGPIQFFGPTDICDKPTLTLQFEAGTEP